MEQPRSKSWAGIYAYPSKGTRRLRFMWGVGRKIKGQVDIRGGNAFNPLVRARAKQVKSWIDAGNPPEAIARLVRQYPAGKRGRPVDSF